MAKTLSISKIARFSFFVQQYLITLPHGHTLADVETPEYFVGVSRDIKKGDEFIVRDEALTFRAHYVVLSNVKNAVVVRQLSFVQLQENVDANAYGEDLKPEDTDKNAPAFIRYNEAKKYHVIRRIDGKVLFDKLETQASAEKALNGYMTQIEQDSKKLTAKKSK